MMLAHRATIGAGLLTFAMLAVAAAPAHSQVTTYFGADDGAPTTGPYPNSTAAQTSFLTGAGAFGSVSTATFENVALGDYANTNFVAGPGLTAALAGPDYGQQFNGVDNQTLGNLYAFNTTPKGANFLAVSADTLTLTFAGGTNSLGLFLTGLQTYYTTAVTFTFNDGMIETLDLPSINVNGGAEYFGFTDTSKFTSITIDDPSSDAWGVDDISYNHASTSVPEPASLAALVVGLGMVGYIRRRRSI